jgi:hypothetical protein
MPLEQSRWNQSNIDLLFYCGCQTFVNRYFNFSPNTSFNNYYFNLVQQPVNLITGYERQHRKAFSYVPTFGADTNTTDQYTRLMTHIANTNGIHEQFSRGCEHAAITGLAMLQPYLDFTGDDPLQGELKVKVWEYNSFLCDPYARSLNFEDSNFIWCQEYLSKEIAEERFPGKLDKVRPMSGTPQRYGSFYFLPENYNMARNDLMVLSYVWYKWRRKKKKLYSRQLNQFFDFAQGKEDIDQLLYAINDLELVEVEVPTWKLAVILNDQLMYQGNNPLGFDDFPMVPIVWNYNPEVNYYDLRCRGIIRTMRDPQFLYNYKVIQNNDIAAATINNGWKRKIGAVANEDNLKKSGQGWDIIINDGYELTDVEKIIPTAVPESDLALATQMADLIFTTSGINLENWSGQQEKQISALTAMIKQAANLTVLQKYFDQWDLAKKQLGDLCLKIQLNNWNAEKVKLLIGEEPSPFFYSRIFSKYNTIVEESDLTPTQQNLQASQMLDINQAFGREVFSPSMIVPKLNITGKAEIIQYLQSQEQAVSAQQEHAQNLESLFTEAKLKEMYAKAANLIASARERHSRSDSNVGLFEERLSELQKNEALSTKAKMEALEKMVEVIAKFGEIEVALANANIESYDRSEDIKLEIDKQNAKKTSASNEFISQLLGNRGQGPNMQQ